MALSFTFNDMIRYDLRQVPLIIGGLYLGPGAAAILYAVLIGFRAYFGVDTGFWLAIFIHGAQTMAIVYLHNWFMKQAPNKKVLLVVFLSLVSSVGLMIFMYLLGYTLGWLEWGTYIFGCSFVAGITTAIIETEKVNFFLKERALGIVKMETISQMSASISHEVRNPLTSVKGFLQLLGEPGFSEQKRSDFVGIAIQELERAERIITDFLTLAKPNEQSFELVNLSKELAHIVKVFEPMTNMASIIVKAKLEDDIFIKGDRFQLHQCIFNLLKNAKEAMPDGGEMTILLKKNTDKAIIHINDTGFGMTEEQIKQYGEPYFSTKGTQGTGLGTMVSSAVIKAHKGTINVTSQPNKGTTITLTLPKMEPE
nr:HAMP domain-containing sensor histidine kinase [Bacillus sp. B-jedd]